MKFTKKKKPVPYLIKIDPDLWDKIVHIAKKNGITRKEIIIQGILLAVK